MFLKVFAVWRDVRQTSGWDHPETRTMVRTYFLAMAVVAVALTQVGCGGGEGGGGPLFGGVGNRPGPWPLALHVSASFPQRPPVSAPADPEAEPIPPPADPGFRVMVQLGGEAAKAILWGGYGGYGQTDVGWPKMRPGQYDVRVWVERADGVPDPALPGQTIPLGISKEGVFSPGDRLDVNLQS